MKKQMLVRQLRNTKSWLKISKITHLNSSPFNKSNKLTNNPHKS